MLTNPLKRKGCVPSLEFLESRTVFAVGTPIPLAAPDIVSLNAFASRIEVRGTAASETVKASKVTTNGINKIKIVYTNNDTGEKITKSYTAASVSSIKFTAAGGDDVFKNTSEKPSTAYGGNGKDVFEGSSAKDTFFGEAGKDVLKGFEGADELRGGDGDDEIHGGAGKDLLYGDAGDDLLEGGDGDDSMYGAGGDDRLKGYAGKDTMNGGEGADVLLGGDGNDILQGGKGKDHLVGQAGTDNLKGGDGDDTIISIDGSVNEVPDGGAGADTYWTDGVALGGEGVATTSGDVVQRIYGFANGADRSLNGDRIADPLLIGGTLGTTGVVPTGHTYRRFSGNPLFSTNGPQMSDIDQGQLGNCWLMSALGAIADTRPAIIRQNIVDFQDGTYGVRLGGSFYRVDDDLPAKSSTSEIPAYAGLGAEDSMWVAIYEKAYAHYRTGANTYSSVAWGSSQEAFEAFRCRTSGYQGTFLTGNPANRANDLHAHWNANEAVTVAIEETPGRGIPLYGDHVYMVHSITRSNGDVTSIKLRNPWANDGERGTDRNPDDGIVTVTPDQLFGQTKTTFRWATF